MYSLKPEMQSIGHVEKLKILIHAYVRAAMHACAGQDASMVCEEEHLVYHATDTGDV